MDLSPGHTSERICDVDVAALVAWAEGPGLDAPWIVQQDRAQKPQRLLLVPNHLTAPLVDRVLACFRQRVRAWEVVLSRTPPGQAHTMHVDQGNPALWLTRVHVPLVTGPGSWHQFEGLERFHLAPGAAYTFNAHHRRHAFGNDGQAERVHLIFDVLRA